MFDIVVCFRQVEACFCQIIAFFYIEEFQYLLSAIDGKNLPPLWWLRQWRSSLVVARLHFLRIFKIRFGGVLGEPRSTNPEANTTMLAVKTYNTPKLVHIIIHIIFRGTLYRYRWSQRFYVDLTFQTLNLPEVIFSSSYCLQLNNIKTLGRTTTWKQN